MDEQRRKPPDYLGQHAAEWFSAVAKEFVFSDEPAWSLLEQAAACLDRLDECREAIARDGLTVPTGAGGVKPHPALIVERDQKSLFCRLLKELRVLTLPDTPKPR
jgi:phage terminase small subunit